MGGHLGLIVSTSLHVCMDFPDRFPFFFCILQLTGFYELRMGGMESYG